MDDACLVDGNNHSWGINLPDGIKNTAVYDWSRNCRIVFDEKNSRVFIVVYWLFATVTVVVNAIRHWFS